MLEARRTYSLLLRVEPPLWRRDDIRARQFTLTVEESTPAGVRVRMNGAAVIATHSELPKFDRGYDVRLLGYIRFSAAEDTIDRFDIVAVGDHWGEGTYTRGARPGRTPLGIAFELASGDSPADRVPRQAAREIGEYLGPAR